MSWFIENRIEEKYFIEVCKNAESMAQAASELGIHFNSFKKRALELDCYKPNKAGIGIRKNSPKLPIEDIIFNNEQPQYQSYKLKIRLIEEGYKNNICETCGISEWNNKSIQMELHHIDGNRTNHHISNIQILCPNCHSQTDNFRAKNKSN